MTALAREVRMVYNSTVNLREYKRAYYLKNRERLLAKAEARRLARAADPVLAAQDRAYMADWARRRRAAHVKPRVRKVPPPDTRYKNPEYAEACRQRSAIRYATIRKLDPIGELLAAAKQRASRKGLAFNLVREKLHIPETCPICGIRLQRAEGRAISASPTLDRVDNARGYELGNVEVICYDCNRIKSDGTADLHERIADYMRKVRVGS